MAGKLKTRITIDVLMTIALIIQMGYMLVGDLAHEITGTVTIVLWIVHNILHHRWYAAIGKRPYPPKRVINTVINLLLLLSVIGIALSAVILSSYVFSFLGIETGMSFARGLHMVSVYWCFVLSSLHLGLHWSRMVKMIKKNSNLKPSKIRSTILNTAAVLIACYGLYAFINQQLASYMFLRTMFVFFDFEQSVPSFFFDYIAMMVLFATAAYFGSAIITKIRLRNRAKNKLVKGVTV